jgi:hypothetical protein
MLLRQPYAFEDIETLAQACQRFGLIASFPVTAGMGTARLPSS